MDSDRVAQLIEQSERDHLAFQLHVRDGQRREAREAVQRARDARLQAHTPDPEHLAAVWTTHKWSGIHDDILEYYDAQLKFLSEETEAMSG